MRPKHTLITILCVVAVTLYFAGAWLAFEGKAHSSAPERSGAVLLPTPTPDPNWVTLKAKPWNNGMVHVWVFVAEGDVPRKDLPAGTRCRKDSGVHLLGSGATAISFYKVNCNGVIGFVEVDQVH